MDKFRVGQKVRIIKSKHPERVGLIATITQKRAWRKHLDGNLIFGYRLDLPPKNKSAKFCSYPEESLAPVYDGDEKISWSECAWNPNEVKV